MPPQIEKVVTSPAHLLVSAACILFLAVALLRPDWHGLFDMVPDELDLRRAEGTLTGFRLQGNEEGLRFQLSGSTDFFVLSPHAGAAPVIRRSLPGARFTVLYDPDRPAEPLWSNRRSFVVYVVLVDGTPVRPYRLVAQDAHSSLAWMPLAGAFCSFLGLSLLGRAAMIRLRQRPKRPNQGITRLKTG
jgi:hypothetical protein